jgi:NADH-quinone oxidoreductase subunit N
MLVVDGFATFFRCLVISVGLVTVLSSADYLHRERNRGGEFYALILFSIAGQSIMASANELIMIFIGLEISSIASYILAGYLRDDALSNTSCSVLSRPDSCSTAWLGSMARPARPTSP